MRRLLSVALLVGCSADGVPTPIAHTTAKLTVTAETAIETPVFTAATVTPNSAAYVGGTALALYDKTQIGRASCRERV